jgi:hypothetical protein
MTSVQLSMREFRFLDEKRKGGPLSRAEQARLQELKQRLGVEETEIVRSGLFDSMGEGQTELQELPGSDEVTTDLLPFPEEESRPRQ